MLYLEVRLTYRAEICLKNFQIIQASEFLVSKQKFVTKRAKVYQFQIINKNCGKYLVLFLK